MLFFLSRFLVLNLPGTLASVMGDSQMNLLDLRDLEKNLSQSQSGVSALIDFFKLNWGTSALYNSENFPIIFERLKVTLFVSVLSVGFLLFFLVAYFYLSKQHRLFTESASKLFLCIPRIVFFPFVVFLLCRVSDQCPAGSTNFFKMAFLASACQAFLATPRIYRELKHEVSGTLQKRFVLVLRAKGIPRRRILMVHVLANVLPIFLSLLVLTFLAFLSGSILLEVLFDIRGIGALTLDAILARDLSLLFPIVVVVGFFNLLTLQVSRFARNRAIE